MKVNTDGVLLGAAVSIHPQDENILDIGTGTGVIALMLAQRYSDMKENNLKHILGIDIDYPSAVEAADNFRNSPWGELLEAKNCSLEQYVSEVLNENKRYSLIVSNPPYFTSSLQAPEQRRNTARHEVSMSYKDILTFAKEKLCLQGRVVLIMPADREDEIVDFAHCSGLSLSRVLRIKTVPMKPYRRVILEFTQADDSTGMGLTGTGSTGVEAYGINTRGKEVNRTEVHGTDTHGIEVRRTEVNRTEALEEELIMQKSGKYTDKYISLTKNFYLDF